MIEGPKGTGLSLQKPLQYFSQKMLDFQFFGKKLKTIFLYNSKCQGPQPFMLLIGDIKPYNFCYQSTFCSDHFLAKYSMIHFTRQKRAKQTRLYFKTSAMTPTRENIKLFICFLVCHVINSICSFVTQQTKAGVSVMDNKASFWVK